MALVHFKLRDPKKFICQESSSVFVIDWCDDFDIINKYYQEHFGIYDLEKDDPGDFEVISTVAYMIDGEVLSLAVIYNINGKELEIGAVSTAPAHRNLGYSSSCVSLAVKVILEKGMTASITTNAENAAMQRVAEKLGFERT